jgi:hypothetical protein
VQGWRRMGQDVDTVKRQEVIADLVVCGELTDLAVSDRPSADLPAITATIEPIIATDPNEPSTREPTTSSYADHGNSMPIGGAVAGTDGLLWGPPHGKQSRRIFAQKWRIVRGAHWRTCRMGWE